MPLDLPYRKKWWWAWKTTRYCPLFSLRRPGDKSTSSVGSRDIIIRKSVKKRMVRVIYDSPVRMVQAVYDDPVRRCLAWLALSIRLPENIARRMHTGLFGARFWRYFAECHQFDVVWYWGVIKISTLGICIFIWHVRSTFIHKDNCPSILTQTWQKNASFSDQVQIYLKHNVMPKKQSSPNGLIRTAIHHEIYVIVYGIT